MSKLKKVYLIQDKEIFKNIQSVDMNKSANILSDKWHIELEMDDIWGLYKAWKNNQTFSLHIEYSSFMGDTQSLCEIVTGEVTITSIQTKIKVSMKKPYTVIGYSNNLNFSSKEQFVREKVQFT
jgi:hypothetical protein